jgi:hypothetical protein
MSTGRRILNKSSAWTKNTALTYDQGFLWMNHFVKLNKSSLFGDLLPVPNVNFIFLFLSACFEAFLLILFSRQND